MKKLSRRETILYFLRKRGTALTCQQITNKIIKREKLDGNVARYLSGSISSKLAKLVKDGLIYVEDSATGLRGGKVYMKEFKN